MVIADTAWRPLATLVRAARHAGMEEAVRRLRAVLIFTLEGSDNRRVVNHPFASRLTLVGAHFPALGAPVPPMLSCKAGPANMDSTCPQHGTSLSACPNRIRSER